MGDTTDNKPVMVGCGCKNMKDVVTFIRERKIEYVELAWADEMGLWHNETVHVGELTYANLQEGVQCKDGRFLLPDPLSARIAPLTQPNTMLFTCKPPTSRNAYLKRKELSPGWIEMISKKLMQNDKSPSIPVSRINDLLEDSVPRTPQHHSHHGYARSGPIGIPRSPGEYSNPASPSSALNSSSGSSPRGLGSPGESPIGSPTGTEVPSPHANTSGFIDWKVVRSSTNNDGYGTSPSLNVFPPSPPISDGNVTPPGSVPGSPCLPGSPRSPVPDSGQEVAELQPTEKGKFQHLVPPLLRPRQIHPTKANKLGITKPVKKRRNTEHLFCRHCGTTETPEWRRGPDGRKSLCNACGLYFSKMIKRETMVVPQGRRVAIDALLNPHS